MANKAAGKGYESTDHYNNVIYEFYNIHNIHVMRESLQRLVEGRDGRERERERERERLHKTSDLYLWYLLSLQPPVLLSSPSLTFWLALRTQGGSNMFISCWRLPFSVPRLAALYWCECCPPSPSLLPSLPSPLLYWCVLFALLQALVEEGRSVLVHCSDGWDRTAQSCALTSLLIDPYYRTLHGFMVCTTSDGSGLYTAHSHTTSKHTHTHTTKLRLLHYHNIAGAD